MTLGEIRASKSGTPSGALCLSGVTQQEHDDDGGEQGSHGVVSPVMGGGRESVVDCPASISRHV